VIVFFLITGFIINVEGDFQDDHGFGGFMVSFITTAITAVVFYGAGAFSHILG
jgi:hypothetical protein